MASKIHTQTLEAVLTEFRARLPDSEGAAVVQKAEANRGRVIDLDHLDDGFTYLPGAFNPNAVFPSTPFHVYEGVAIHRGELVRYAELCGDPTNNTVITYDVYRVYTHSGVVTYDHLCEAGARTRLLELTGCEVHTHDS